MCMGRINGLIHVIRFRLSMLHHQTAPDRGAVLAVGRGGKRKRRVVRPARTSIVH